MDDLEDAMLSEISPTQKDRPCLLPLYAPTHMMRACVTDSQIHGDRK